MGTKIPKSAFAAGAPNKNLKKGRPKRQLVETGSKKGCLFEAGRQFSAPFAPRGPGLGSGPAAAPPFHVQGGTPPPHPNHPDFMKNGVLNCVVPAPPIQKKAIAAPSFSPSLCLADAAFVSILPPSENQTKLFTCLLQQWAAKSLGTVAVRRLRLLDNYTSYE